ncbi:hypothetical protein [Mycobacteroides abscessus]|uniref:hypothetical protein n=1 Tax=Mycobacteroides abscessus TaxID=36809 RepID=UPI0009A5FF06|nr:hypothetical protein [Mycobacteroides abscessus]SKH86975.1 Uncharacterised protein [Mycobacteroides abscessus subsp. massiliense]SKH91486.1 Uncharacterised protein [Mycobacteroides abscessus subsp. massiliense]SKI12337.1 Uncharacterised protein [Mycobacteroides abscessus subsp. massiliense]SKK23321.1 Uncharacterised protein [Mycobacteroides abscessus subsp. massiliense]SKK29887.1 Uncharacterised protein [Mycobacteroides abscessus subsp. massiliense]
MATLIHARERAAWILNHTGPYLFQRRRGQLLEFDFDEEQRIRVGAPYNANVQVITERLWSRSIKTIAAARERAVVVVAGALFPVGWPLGRLLYLWLARKVADPETGEVAIPIVALSWLGAVIMLLFALGFDPSGSTFSGVVLLPWLVIQGAGTFLMAAVYAIMDGWLAIRGSTAIWPYPEKPLPEASSLTKEERPYSGPAISPAKDAPRPMSGPAHETNRPMPWER